MSRKGCFPSYVKCGEVFHTELPNQLEESEPPIVLAEINVNTKHIPRPCVLIKFSEFINFSLLGLNPKLNIIYRLVREDGCSEYAQILQEWEFEFESNEVLEIANIDTNQPTVLNYCDCLDECICNRIIYRLEIVRIQTNSVESFGLTNESITATVLKGVNEVSTSRLPYVSCGKVFNPVLPLCLSREDKPVDLAQLTINTECNRGMCVLLNFSSFLTSILKEEHFNDLTFRLVRTSKDCNTEVLEEWRFRRSFVNDTNIKEPLVYNFCECLSPGFNTEYTYTMQLVEADLSEDSSYNITQKSMTAQVFHSKDQQEYYETGRFCLDTPLLNCGRVCEDIVTSESIDTLPINLAFVKVDTNNIKRPHVLINYSQNLEFEFGGLNPEISIVYRLIRKSNYCGSIRVLECWNYRASENIPTIVQDIITIEPLVINYCDCLDDRNDESFTYIVQIVKIITENTSFKITNQEISAIVSSGGCDRERRIE